MATTPPPLPSSSEDSDFDEDDFGCFKSSTPVVKASKEAKQNRKSDAQQNDTIKKIDGTDSERLNISEAATNVHCIGQVSKPNEDPCTEPPHIHSPQVNDITHTAASPQDLTMINASDKEEEENDENSNFSYTDKSLSESAEDSQHLPNEKVLGKDEEDREVDHSTALDEEGFVENVVEQTSVVTNDINSDRDTGCVDGDRNENNEMEIQNSGSPSLESTDEHAHTSEKGDKEGNEEDDFDDWSDMQEFHSGDSNLDDVKDAGIADQIDDGKSQSSCDHNIDSNNSDDSKSVDEDVNVKPETIVSDSFPPCQDIPCETSDTSVPDQCPIPAEKDNDDEDFGAFDMDKDNTSNSNHKEVVSVSELSPQNDIPNIPSPNYEDDNEQAVPCDDQIEDDNEQAVPCDDQIEDDDDFGDFADFSSHQESDNNVSKVEDPISLSARSTDQQVDKADDDDNEGFDAFVMDSSKNNTDMKSSTDSEKANMNIAEEGHAATADDDDDWGFKSADAGGSGQGNDDDDDFGNFGDFGSAENKNDGGWASFNDTSTAAADDDVDDFDDFSGSNFQTPSSADTNSSMLKAQDNSSKVEKVVFVCFPSVSSQPPLTAESPYEPDSDKSTSKPDVTSSEIDALCSVIEMGLEITPRAKEETWTIVKELRNKNPVVGTWGRLKDVNSSHALDHGWSTSHCCQEVFVTLHIDTKNVLFSQKKQAVPFYASGLGILEPTRGAPNPAEKSQQPVQPILLDTGKPDEHSKKVLDIPPVDFDWGSSGLTNPLKVFKAESFNTGMTSLDSFSDVLQKNLEPAKELSVEAKKILSKMPNLSFMRSKVLMFPIKD